MTDFEKCTAAYSYVFTLQLWYAAPSFFPGGLGGLSFFSAFKESKTLFLESRVVTVKSKTTQFLRNVSSVGSQIGQVTTLCVFYSHIHESWKVFVFYSLYILNTYNTHTFDRSLSTSVT